MCHQCCIYQTPESKILLEELTGAQSLNSHNFMQPEGLLLCLKQLTTWIYMNPFNIYLSIIILSSYLHPGFWRVLSVGIFWFCTLISVSVNVQPHSKGKYLLLATVSSRLLVAPLSPVSRTASCPTASPILLYEENSVLTHLLSYFQYLMLMEILDKGNLNEMSDWKKNWES